MFHITEVFVYKKKVGLHHKTFYRRFFHTNKFNVLCYCTLSASTIWFQFVVPIHMYIQIFIKNRRQNMEIAPKNNNIPILLLLVLFSFVLAPVKCNRLCFFLFVWGERNQVFAEKVEPEFEPVCRCPSHKIWLFMYNLKQCTIFGTSKKKINKTSDLFNFQVDFTEQRPFCGCKLFLVYLCFFLCSKILYTLLNCSKVT